MIAARALRAGAALALVATLSVGVAACATTSPGATTSALPAVEERSIAELQAEMTAGRATSESLVLAYLARIEAIDRGRGVNSVLAVNPDALAQARALDAERAAGRVRGPLHGVPVLLKDNIETLDPMPTTAGSLALADNVTGRDAPLVARLREAGAVVLGKTNLSEWANIRSGRSISGWSAVGGQTRNPYALDRSPCGSSSGSGAAAASSLAAGTVGTETDGSITCPSSVNGVVGLKPTVGLISRARVVPISSSQDTAGPMTRTVADAAVLLSAMAGSDPLDPATAEADARRTDYVKALDANALQGRRIGVMRFHAGFHDGTDAVFERALAELRAAGAELVEIRTAPSDLGAIGRDEFAVLLAELKTDLNAYLATTPETVETRTLADVIAFNAATPEETALFGQELFIAAQAGSGAEGEAYARARETSRRLAGAEGIDKMLREHRVDALVAPTVGPAWPIDPALGDRYVGGGSSRMAAVAGYPHLTVPMGEVRGLPVGLSFVGPAWSEARLLAFGYAFEQRSKARRAPTYPATLLDRPEVRDAFAGPR